MEITASQVKNLRLRLGWSLAEMARQMGCTVEIISAWESGKIDPDPEAKNQISYLETYVETYNDKIAQKPMAEREMEDRMLSQLTHQDFSSNKN